MTEQHFDLVSEPWIQVVRLDDETIATVSLADLFAHAHEYRELSGDMRAQDLAIMRVLLAILHTVYSRYTPEGQAYDWLDLDPETMMIASDVDQDDFQEDDLYDTWETLYNDGRFGEIVTAYLQKQRARFDFFGDNPFYQVNAEDYDRSVPANKRVELGKGTVSVKQINRSISESNNTPALFAPTTNLFKDQVDVPELVRWLISYQSYTGVTDKTKVSSDEAFSNPYGWVYGLTPVYVQGKSLFETLLLNLVLVDPTAKGEYFIQHPVWEMSSVAAYLEQRKKMIVPDNIAELYTAWARLITIVWTDDVPQIFSAGIPMFPNTNAFIEPMTVWREDQKAKPPVWRPARKRLANLNVAMWRNFGEYVAVKADGSDHQPGVVDWLQQLKTDQILPVDRQIRLETVALVSDGNATSQAPAAEAADTLQINIGVLFDDRDQNFWPARIDGVITLTQEVARDYGRFIRSIATIRNSSDGEFVSRETGKLYARLNTPFVDWLAHLTPEDDRDEKINRWKKILRRVVLTQQEAFLQNVSPRDIRGIARRDSKGNALKEFDNIFTVSNTLVMNLNKRLN